MSWTGGCLCGAIRYEARVSVSGNWYCHCGSPMFFRPTNEDWISILSGTLDDPELAPPKGHYGVESWISWLKIEDDLKQEETEKTE